MLTLDLLKPARLSKDLKRAQLSTITAITEARLRELELRETEPWYDEALLLSRALCVDGIVPLITSGTLTDIDAGPPYPADLDVWRSTARLPLSVAVRVSRRFGLADPAQLHTDALTLQIWAVVGSSERHPAMQSRGFCPWCAVDTLGSPHLPSCLPNNLWGPKSAASAADMPAGLVRVQRGGRRACGIPAYGLKALRLARELRQSDVAAMAGINVNHYARIERADLNLTPQVAERLGALFKVDITLLYAATPGIPGLGDV